MRYELDLKSRDAETFETKVKNVQQLLSKKRPIDEVFWMGEAIIKTFPERAGELLDVIGQNLNQPKDPGSMLFLWRQLVSSRKDLASKFLRLAITSENQHELFGELVGYADCRQHIPLIKDALEHAAAISDKLAENVIQDLMAPALRDAMKNGRGTKLFDFLVNQPSLSTMRWKTEEGEGNAFFMWVMNTPDINNTWSMGDNKHTLMALIQAGVRADETSVININSNIKNQTRVHSLMELACWMEDNVSRSKSWVIEQLLDAGISWKGHEIGNNNSSETIKNHPLVSSYLRREALEDIIPDDKKKPRDLKIRM